MIDIEIDFGVMLYLLLAMLILILWLAFERRSNRRAKPEEEDFFWKCPICFNSYIDSRASKISECPKCKTLHKKEKKV